MATFSIVDCCEVHVSQSEQWGEDSVQCQAQLRCAWNVRHLLSADLLGNARAWPYGSWAAPPRCRSVSIQPVETSYTQSDQGFTYEDAIVTANYSTKQPEDQVAESLEPTVEFMTLDYRRFRWSDQFGDPLQEGEAPGKLVRGLNLVRTVYKTTSIPASVLSLPGTVNQAAYTSSLLGLTFPAETLLYAPPSLSRTITSAGVEAWNMTLKFTYKPDGWNRFWREKTQAYERIYLVGAGAYYNYPLDDFSDFLS